MTKKLPLIVSAVSGLVLFSLVIGATGFWVAHRELWPYKIIIEAKQIVLSFIQHGEVIPLDRRRIAPKDASPAAATVHDAAASMGSGHYALLAWDNAHGSYVVFLYDASGARAHTWPVDTSVLTDDADHTDYVPHAMELLPDGSVLVSFDGLKLVTRLNPCGDAIWSNPMSYHHSFSPASDGGVWTWQGDGTAFGQIQDILKFDPLTGEDMLRISLTEDVIKKSPENAMVFSMFTDFPFTPGDQSPHDHFHPNDVEELMPELAAAFPQFAAGDLMLSFRQLDMVLIMSQAGEIKWYRQGPWLKQHDPDFEPGGRIAIYNNGEVRPRSSILLIDPKSGVVTDALPAFTAPFTNMFRGKHQLLPNGNRLITIPAQGQALEVAPDGRVVMEFNNIIPGKPGVHDDVANAKWVPDGFFETIPQCTSTAEPD